MSDLPVPLALEQIPPGTRAWQAADAERWRAAGPGRWADPLWPFLALLATAVWSIAEAPYPVCTTAIPCTTDWPGVSLATIEVLTLVLLRRHPALALPGLVVSVGGLLLDDAPDGSPGLLAASSVALLLAALYAAATLIHRLVCVRQQQLVALEAADGARAPLPGPAGTFRRGQGSFALASLLLAVSVFAVWQGEQDASAFDERVSRATPATARVVESDDEGGTLTVRSEALGTHTVEVLFPEAYPVGSHLDLLVDGDWIRPAAEPYDTFGWELLLLVSSVPALTFLVNGLVARRRAARLRAEPAPVLRVLLASRPNDARTWLHAADDRAAERPLLSFHTRYVFEEDHPEDDYDPDDLAEDEDDDFDEAGEAPRLREAVLYGSPHAGAELVLVSALEEDGPLTECTVSPARPAPLLRPETTSRRRPTADVVAALPLSREPLVWSADTGARIKGLGFLVLGVFVLASAWGDGFSWRWIVAGLALPWHLSAAATTLNWRVVADDKGLWLCGAWRVRHVPWDAVKAVSHVDDGIRVGIPDDELRLSPTGWSWLARRLGRRSTALDAAESLRVLVHHPELRPRTSAGHHGLPLGPYLAAATVLWAGTQVFLR
ncbi:hypothetical protein ACIGBL_22315 [Streptomyces sp. NPDC085614]|uniref:hypothetical protein n=1 Tax=Streptomyces sp. NPDC085614 TaxID=3365733 RepID=UPI0037D394D2